MFEGADDEEREVTAELDLFHAPPRGGWTSGDVAAVARTTDRRFELHDGAIIVTAPQIRVEVDVKSLFP